MPKFASFVTQTSHMTPPGKLKVTSKGLDTLKSSSIERKDLCKEHAFSKIVPPICLHKNCWIKFTNQNEIKNCFKRKLKDETLSSLTEAKTPRLRYYIETSFNSKTHCIFCNEPLCDHPRNRQNQSQVSTILFLENMKTVITRQKDSIEGNNEWGNGVKLRIIGSDSDVIVGDGRYHRKCYQYFYNNITNSPWKYHPGGRPQGATNEVSQSAFK